MIAATCLALAMYFEARGEDAHGQSLVGYVVLNRVDDPRWPDNVCDVVYQNAQFSWTQDGKSDVPHEGEAWDIAQAMAKDMLDNPVAERPTEAVYFHSGATPYWAASQTFVEQHGAHRFYK